MKEVRPEQATSESTPGAERNTVGGQQGPRTASALGWSLFEQALEAMHREQKGLEFAHLPGGEEATTLNSKS